MKKTVWKNLSLSRVVGAASEKLHNKPGSCYRAQAYAFKHDYIHEQKLKYLEE